MAHSRMQFERGLVLSAACVPSLPTIQAASEWVRTGVAPGDRDDVIPYDPQTTPQLMDEIMRANGYGKA